jgi:2-polyprenyl-3-methyl-5-hydroxy-6-metoxy-1,4-benzoquinol methylase
MSGQPRAPLGLELLRSRGGDYGRLVHDRKIGLLRTPLGRVLDVGCAEGAGIDVLRARGATHVAGIELDERFAAEAAKRYDEVVCGSVPDAIPWPEQSFDTILCYDVLEHLYDPWSATRRLARLLKPGGRLHLSLPNARNKEVWLPLVLNGRFRYQPEGLMDVTHIRFFGRRDAVEMLEAAGLEIVSQEHPDPESIKRRVANRLTRGWAMEFLTIQWFVLAERPVVAPGPDLPGPRDALSL